MIEFKGQMPWYIVQYKPGQRAIRHFMDRSGRAGIGQWHEYDHVACNSCVLLTAARAIPSHKSPNGTTVRECIEYGIAQSSSQ